MEKGHSQLGCDELKVDGDFLVEEIRQGKCRDNEKKRKCHDPDFLPAEMEPQYSHQHQEKGEVKGVEFASEFPQPEEQDAEEQRGHPQPDAGCVCVSQ